MGEKPTKACPVCAGDGVVVQYTTSRRKLPCGQCGGSGKVAPASAPPVVARNLPPGGLTSQERFLLEWLSKEDFSALGECEGQALTVLINCGLAEVTDKHRGGWAKVALTPAGQGALQSTGEGKMG